MKGAGWPALTTVIRCSTGVDDHQQEGDEAVEDLGVEEVAVEPLGRPRTGSGSVRTWWRTSEERLDIRSAAGIPLPTTSPAATAQRDQAAPSISSAGSSGM